MSFLSEIAARQTQDDLHPIDIVECIAEHHEWDFERMDDDQIALAIEGQWRTYSISLAWSAFDDTLRMVLTFEMEPPTETRAALFEMLNNINDQCWSGAFTFWCEQQLMVYRYGLICSGCNDIAPEQVHTMIKAAVGSAERFYPALQLVVWGGKTPNEAMQIAISHAYGTA